MSDLTKVRAQVIDPTTGLAVEVDTKTSAYATYLENGTSLQGYINNSEEIFNSLQSFLIKHLNVKHVDADKVKDVVTGVVYDDTTGTFTVTSHNGTETKFDTLLEKTAVGFDLVDGTDENEGKKILQITLDDGTIKEVDFTSFVDIYTGSNGSQIVVSVNNGVISGSVVAGSIGESKLTDELVAEIKAQFELEAATTSKLGGVIIGDGLSVVTDGTTSMANTTVNSEAKGLNFESEGVTEVITVAGPTTDYLYTIVDAELEAPLEVTATTSGVGTLEYQWYKKTIGVDAGFVAIEGANANTYTVPVDTAGTTMYYCTVTSTGDGVVALPVNSTQAMVCVEESAIIAKVDEALDLVDEADEYVNNCNTQIAIMNNSSSTPEEADAALEAALVELDNAKAKLAEAKALMGEAKAMSNKVILPANVRTITDEAIEDGISAVADTEAAITTAEQAIGVSDDNVVLKMVNMKVAEAEAAATNAEGYANTATAAANTANNASTSSEANTAATEAEAAATNAANEAQIAANAANAIEEISNNVTVEE